jgi:signal transduction histidine kinase
MDSSNYSYRKVSIGEQWFIEIEGLNPVDQAELEETLAALEAIHEWPVSKQVIVGVDGSGRGSQDSNALDIYNWYVKEVRIGPHRPDVVVTPVAKAVLNREQILRGTIRKALKQDDLDYSKIITLSSELASLDETNLRFSVDAGIINRLGKELVGRAETALSELVKNGYDSDATQVILTFTNNSKIGGSLTVVDNGNGMTQSELVNGFMRLSSTDKIHHPKSPVFKRTRAGRKGIGRFATQRLGLKLTIITQTATATDAIKVTIDWSRFVTDSNLLTIESKIETVAARAEGKGTALLIEGLREAWSEASIKRAYRYLSELLQPFPLSAQLSQGKNDPGFKVDVYQQEATGKPRVIINEERAFYDHAVAIIEGYVDEKGVGFWAVESKKLGIAQDVQPLGKSDGIQSKPYDHLRNVHLKAYYFIFEAGLFPPSTMTAVRETLREQGGIRVYRNGFRVLPYGEQDDDWTGLDASVRQNIILVPHGNNSFLGFVELIDAEGNQFDETSGRERLVENPAFAELSDFTRRALTGGVLRIAAERGRKGSTREKRKPSQKPTDTIKDAAQDALNKIESLKQELTAGPSAGEPVVTPTSEDRPPAENINSPISAINEFADTFRAILGATAQQEQQTTKLIEEINQLRVLAGLGLVIGQFVHEIKTYVTSFNLDIQELSKLLGGNDEAIQVLATIKHNVQAFSTYRSYFERVISDNVSRELEPLELREVVRPFIKTITPDAEKSGITILPTVFEGYDLFTVPMHRSEWASILFNFYSNAKKAIHPTDRAGQILIKCGKAGGVVYLEFSDNGVGIPIENEEKVFDAFFTTSQPPSRQASFREELTGMGLGLKIVRDIVESYQGSIFVALPEPGFNTTLRIQIPTNRTK